MIKCILNILFFLCLNPLLAIADFTSSDIAKLQHEGISIDQAEKLITDYPHNTIDDLVEFKKNNLNLENSATFRNFFPHIHLIELLPVIRHIHLKENVDETIKLINDGINLRTLTDFFEKFPEASIKDIVALNKSKIPLQINYALNIKSKFKEITLEELINLSNHNIRLIHFYETKAHYNSNLSSNDFIKLKNAEFDFFKAVAL